MEFIESPAFGRQISQYLHDEGYRALQNELARNPQQGDLMTGTGGFRKVRWADSGRGKGRRGGLRIIYYYFVRDSQIWLMTLFDTNEAADLSPKEKKALKAAIEAELAAREAKRELAKPGSRRPRQ
jgi:mRNA-degrading endonuclease RelE of RelBE toxin-antitoxin system